MHVNVLIGCLEAIAVVVPSTLLLTLFVVIFGILLGAVFAVIRLKQVRFLSRVVAVIVAYARGTPLVVQIYIVYNSLTYFLAWAVNAVAGTELKYFDIPILITICVAFVIEIGGIQSEYIRSALMSVGYDQTEACYSIGMTEGQAFVQVIFPQALSVAIPNFFTQYMNTLKQTSIAFIFGVKDILAAAKIYANLETRFTECYIAAAIAYWILGTALTFLFNRWEDHSRRGMGLNQKQADGERLPEGAAT